MTKLSVLEFRKLLKEQVEKVSADHGWNTNSAPERGWAFQLFLAQVVAQYEVGFEESDPEDACLFSKDLGVDIVFEDPTRQHLLLCQAKYQGFDKTVDEKEVNDFFNRHDRLCDRKWVLKHGSEKAAELLGDYGEKVAAGYSVTLYFVSTASSSDRTREMADAATALYASRGLTVRCDFFDFTRLKDYYVRSLSLEESGPAEVQFQLPADTYIQKDEPFPTLIATLKGNELRNLYQRYKESIYAWNIRGYLGNRGINHDIYSTAQQTPELFFYFNNGVSAICTDFHVDEDHLLRAQNLQVINGAQTVSTLAKAEPNPDISVLFRLTKTKSVKTEKGFTRDIIQFNNTQNAIKVSDFRSNDEIQVWLENRFKQLKATSVLPNLFYLRKRAVGRKGSGYGLRLEELAKIRYAFLREPTLIHASPKSLWSLKEDDGVYEVAFGVDGSLQPTWSDETFRETLLAIAVYQRLDEEIRERTKKAPEIRFLKRLRFHALSLAGVYIREQTTLPTTEKLLHSKPDFQALWNPFWTVASGVLTDVYSTAMEQDSTMFAFVRSEDRWDQMRKRLRLRFAVSA